MNIERKKKTTAFIVYNYFVAFRHRCAVIFFFLFRIDIERENKRHLIQNRYNSQTNSACQWLYEYSCALQ